MNVDGKTSNPPKGNSIDDSFVTLNNLLYDDDYVALHANEKENVNLNNPFSVKSLYKRKI